MKAAVLRESNCVNIEDVPMPSLAEGCVLVRVAAVAMNHFDLYSVRGMAFEKRRLPVIIGAEGTGTVVELGPGADKRWLGKRVAIFPGAVCGRCRRCRSERQTLCEDFAGIRGFHINGLAAEYAVVEQGVLFEVPGEVPEDWAACCPITFATVLNMLLDRAHLKNGETILVHAAGSGVGSSAVRVAKHIGATVFATVGSEQKEEKAKRIGVDHVINYAECRFSKVVRRLTPRKGVDVVFEHIGADTFEDSLLSLSEGGRLVTCGSTSGISSNVNLQMFIRKQLELRASYGGDFPNVEHALAMMSEGKIAPVIDSTYGIESIDTAIDRLRERSVFGKLIINV